VEQLRQPTAVEIGGHRVIVEIQDGLLLDRGIYGYYDFSRGVIVIDSGISHSLQNETFWHEMTHMVDVVYFNNQMFDENQTDIFAQGLFQVMKSLGITFDFKGR